MYYCKFRNVLLFSMLIKATIHFLIPTRHIPSSFYAFHARQWRTEPIFQRRHMRKALCGEPTQIAEDGNHVQSRLSSSKLISISPGGFKGFYMMGVIAFLKEHYDLSEYIFSGASAGSWNAILCSYRRNLTEFSVKIIGDKPKLTKNESISGFEHLLKQRILEHATDADFDLSRVFIGVTTLTQSHIKTSIFSNFINLEDALNCCVASSHVPFVTGGLINKYKDIYSFDGGFSRYPYYSDIEPTLHITPSMWEPPRNKSWMNIEDYTTLLCKEKYNFNDLFHQGYEDTQKNREKLDKIFFKEKIT